MNERVNMVQETDYFVKELDWKGKAWSREDIVMKKILFLLAGWVGMFLFNKVNWNMFIDYQERD